MTERFAVIRQGYHVIDTHTNQNRRFKTCAEAQSVCAQLNEWWNNVVANGGTDENYSLHWTAKRKGYNSND